MQREQFLKNQPKGWFFEKINKIDKCLHKLTKRHRENTQINRIRNKTRDTEEM